MDWTVESAALRALRIGLLMQDTEPDQHPAYQAWLDRELAAQPARLAAAGKPVHGADPPEPTSARVMACYEQACASCGAAFTRTGHGDKYCAACRRPAQLAYSRAYNRAVRRPRAMAGRAP